MTMLFWMTPQALAPISWTTRNMPSSSLERGTYTTRDITNLQQFTILIVHLRHWISFD